jgi:hypothetical protein
MKRHILIALGLSAYATAATTSTYYQYPFTYAAKTGALSYTVFNLSPNTCTFTAYEGGKNPSAVTTPTTTPITLDNSIGYDSYSNSASYSGWNNDFSGSLTGLSVYSFFNNPSYSSVQYYYVFFQGISDPISAPSPTLTALSTGASGNPVEYSTGTTAGNPPALADSWTISCGAGNGTIVMANMASAGNAFDSNGAGTGTNGVSAPTFYDEFNDTVFYNYDINPPSPGASDSTTNPNGAGFVGDGSTTYPNGKTMNFNSSDTAGSVQTGGLWMGLYNPNTNNYAVNGLNLAMYPINLAAYVESEGPSTIDDTGHTIYHAPLYGGHFTLAIGDPYLISSYAAKTLWYWITSPNLALNDQSFGSATGMNDILNALAPSGSDAVFKNGSYSALYLQWLLNSPSLAAGAISTLNTAASKPVTKTSIWGKIFSDLADTAIDAAASGLPSAVGPEAGIAVGAVSSTVANGLASDATSAIEADFTTTTSNPPLATTAPPIINATYASTNLLGLLLANTFVQVEINNTLGLGNASAFALWSNYSISTDSLCTSIEVDNNLMGGTCSSTSNDGSQSAVTYTNVLSTYPNSYSTSQLSIWDAILTGSDISTGEVLGVSTNAHGIETFTNLGYYMQLENPTLTTFSPPVQLVYTTTAVPDVTGANVTFNNSSGLLTLASYTTSTNTDGVILGAGSSVVPTTIPTLTLVTPMHSTDTTITKPSTEQVTLDATGLLTVTGYQVNSIAYSFKNGTQTLDMTTCTSNTAVNLVVYPVSTNETSSLGFLSCQSPPSLPYNLCTSDPNATGGVIAAVTGAPTDGASATFELGCVCIPSYLGGPSSTASGTLGGVIVGATSSNPTLQCN